MGSFEINMSKWTYFVLATLFASAIEWVIWFSSHAPNGDIAYQMWGFFPLLKLFSSISVVLALMIGFSTWYGGNVKVFVPCFVGALVIFLFLISSTNHQQPPQTPDLISYSIYPQYNQSDDSISEIANTWRWLVAFIGMMANFVLSCWYKLEK